MRLAVPLSLLLMLFAGTQPAAADEDAELRRLRREQLLRVAKRSVDPGNPTAGGLDDIRRITQAQRAEFAAGSPEVFERLDTLVGTTADASVGVTEGIIPQGARLYRWVTGELLPEERHDLERVRAWREAKLAERLDAAAAKREAAAAKKKDDGSEASQEPAEDLAAETARIRAEVDALPAPASAGWDVKKPGFVVLPPEGDPVALAATPPVDLTGLDAAQRGALVHGQLSIDLARDTGPAGDVVNLQGISQLRSMAGLVPTKDKPRFALVRPDELAWIASADYVAWRALQVAARRESLADQTVPNLVSDADVEVRRKRLAVVQAQRKAAADRVQVVLAAFDQLADAERFWQRDVGQRGFEIEETATRCENCTPEQEQELKRGLARLQLRERAAQQELRLIYITALRAEARLRSLTQSLALANEELVLAEASLQRYADAQSRTRRETQLAELRLQAEDLRVERTRVEGDLERDAISPDGRAAAVDYMAAAGSMLELNERLIRIVRLRRTLEARAAGKTEVEAGRAAAVSSKSGARTNGAPAGTKPAEGSVTESAIDPLSSVRKPATQELNAGYVVLAREKLQEPAFDADLVAEHHAAASDGVARLRAALRAVDAAALSREAFDRLADDVQRRIPPRPTRLWHTTYPERLRQMRSAYADSTTAIAEKREQITERIQLLEVWMTDLENLGVRSFRIRKDRTINDVNLRAAAADWVETRRRAVRWLGWQGQAHIGTYVRDHALSLLLLVVMLIVSYFVVRYGRRWIDERLTRLAVKEPELQEDAITIGAEAEEAKQQRDAIEAARNEAEQAALADASGESDLKGTRVRGSAGEAGEGA